VFARRQTALSMSAQAEQARLQRDMAEQMMKTAARYAAAPVYAPKK